MYNKIITIPFNIELAKKIENKRSIGVICTREGAHVRILDTHVKGPKPICAAVHNIYS